MSQVALNFKFSGAPPRTLLGELTALSQIPTWWGGGSLPLPKNPALGSSGLGLRLFAPKLRPSFL